MFLLWDFMPSGIPEPICRIEGHSIRVPLHHRIPTEGRCAAAAAMGDAFESQRFNRAERNVAEKTRRLWELSLRPYGILFLRVMLLRQI